MAPSDPSSSSEQHEEGSHPWKLPVRVRVQNVVNRPELNGQLGLALRYAAKTKRYAVRLDSCAHGSVQLLGDRLVPMRESEEVSEGVLSINGFAFCAAHRIETCADCKFDFAIPNRLTERGHDPLNPLGQQIYKRAEHSVAQERAQGKPPLAAPPKSST